ncbi:virulence factor [Flavihumibacter profundi]|uniref:virulence factor n=1 Tax=Flavihumibacter profundi TaxID=2716883 RepID=UPI001CC423E8|nr:virulence factor [Flavihumibacter profundi]MBZ5858455.1 virulence factor [Flavihumibacter profundi]
MRGTVISILLLAGFTAFAQPDFPVKYYPAKDTHKPIVFYISGDGGWNNFSTKLASTINANGFRVASLNARDYFWNKKTAEQTALDITNNLQKEYGNLQNEKIIFIGYSFGADVLPFIINQLQPGIREKISGLLLLAPSSSTDFEIHVSDILGFSNSRKLQVAEAINALQIQKTVAVFGADDKNFPLQSIHLKNFTAISLPGGHHFEGNTDELAQIMFTNF